MVQKSIHISELLRSGSLEKYLPKLLEDISRQPDNSDIYIMLAVLYCGAKDFKLALQYANMAIGLEPHYAGHKVTLSTIYGAMGDFERAGKIMGDEISKSANVPALLWNYGLWLLANGRFEEGWKLYKWRRVHTQGNHRFVQREFDINLDGKQTGGTILIWPEQGLGDQVQNFRFVERIKDQLGFDRVILEAPQELFTLFASNSDSKYIDMVYQGSRDLNTPYTFDHHCSIMELPYNLQVHSHGDWGSMPYLKATESVCNNWENGLSQAIEKGQTRIGICWKGSRVHVNDVNRSMELKDLLPLVDCGELIGLQLNVDEDIPDGMKVHNVIEGMINVDFTAALIEQLDCVVTVDTMIAHLAGSLGVPTFMLVPYVNEWRWGMRPEMGTRSHLYDSVRICRQQELGDWTTPVNFVVSELGKKAKIVSTNGQKIGVT